MKSIGCDDFLTLMDAYLDDELDAESAHHVEGHCQQCGSCSDRLEEARRLGVLMRNLGAAQASMCPAELRDAVLSATAEEIAGRDADERSSRRLGVIAGIGWTWAAAASVLLVLSPDGRSFLNMLDDGPSGALLEQSSADGSATAPQGKAPSMTSMLQSRPAGAFVGLTGRGNMHSLEALQRMYSVTDQSTSAERTEIPRTALSDLQDSVVPIVSMAQEVGSDLASLADRSRNTLTSLSSALRTAAAVEPGHEPEPSAVEIPEATFVVFDDPTLAQSADLLHVLAHTEVGGSYRDVYAVSRVVEYEELLDRLRESSRSLQGEQREVVEQTWTILEQVTIGRVDSGRLAKMQSEIRRADLPTRLLAMGAAPN